VGAHGRSTVFGDLAPETSLILSKEHHDVHHASPYDTYYCITVGVWNPLLDRIRFFARTERLLRRIVPGADSRLRVEREGSLNER
jgi:sterol desaturase/sphingolipid hydroxylase (fatty acid hydroxylase superfamily)